MAIFFNILMVKSIFLGQAFRTGPRDCSTSATKPKTGIVLINMGGPEKTEQVYDYLYKIMTDRDMIQLPMAQK